MHEQIAGQPGAIFLPAPPTRESVSIEWLLRNGSLPGVPIEVLRRQIRRRRIFPSAGRIIAAQPALNESDITQDALRDEFFRLLADLRTHALRTDLDDPA